MIYSDEVKKYVDLRFNKMVDLFGYKKDDIQYKLSLCNNEEKFLMKYLYSSMPLSDIANYDFELFYEYVKHAIFLSNKMLWASIIPEDIFLNYVLCYRINNEDIENCRKLFYDMIHHRVENKSMYEAILEVNYWCAENVSYKSTDSRTASPLTVLKSKYGRCGEESTFTVTALRSLGIPARQIYTPRWAHCDDNHAWVEVWCDGKWYYLGACEPEPILNKGWFTSAASRALVIHSRIFSQYFKNEVVVSKNEVVTTINNISKYADSKAFTVKVVDSKDNPVLGAKVIFEVLNYSELFPIAELCTDENGIASINIGLGTIAISVVKDDKFINKIVDIRAADKIVVNIDDTVEYEKEVNGEDITIVPPADKKIPHWNISQEEKAAHKKKLEHCNNVREEKISSIIKEINDNIEKLTKDNDKKLKNSNLKAYYDEVKDILLSAAENYNEIVNFLSLGCDDDDMKIRVGLLKSLSQKDYVDCKCSILNSHINNAVIFKNDYTEEIYFNYVLCPRIYNEKITDFRKSIINYFSNEQKESFIKNPCSIWKYIDENIKELSDYEYEPLYTTPAEVLKMGMGSFMSKKILFVAVCRSIGIPARLNSADLSMEYYKYDKESNHSKTICGTFTKICDEYNAEESHILINNISESELKYFQNWTIAVLKNGVYKTLSLDKNIPSKDKVDICVKPNHYRILTSNRMPNGNIFVKKYVFEVKNNETKKINISINDVQISDMLENYELQDFNLLDKNNNMVPAHSLIKEKKGIIIWIEEGKEPTEHILNEMIELHESFNSIKSDIIFVLRDNFAFQNKTLQKVYQLIPNIKTYFDDFSENASTIARRMYLEVDKFPLILVCDKASSQECNIINGIYASVGYNVGLGELLIKIVKNDDMHC